MNIITKGTNSILIFTLEERRTVTNAHYLVRLQSRSSRGIKRFILPAEQSSYVDRFNQFTVTETSSTEILTSGTVTLTPAGLWDYNIYEQSSASNLDENLSDNPIPLETGLLLVKTQNEQSHTYYSEGGTENKFFEP